MLIIKLLQLFDFLLIILTALPEILKPKFTNFNFLSYVNWDYISELVQLSGWDYIFSIQFIRTTVTGHSKRLNVPYLFVFLTDEEIDLTSLKVLTDHDLSFITPKLGPWKLFMKKVESWIQSGCPVAWNHKFKTLSKWWWDYFLLAWLGIKVVTVSSTTIQTPWL